MLRLTLVGKQHLTARIDDVGIKNKNFQQLSAINKRRNQIKYCLCGHLYEK